MDIDILPIAIIVKNTEDGKPTMQLKAGKPISCEKSVEEIVDEWANSVCTLGSFEYIPS